jgi:hypothetical protein
MVRSCRKNAWGDINKICKWKLITTRPAGRPKSRCMDNVMKDIQTVKTGNWKRCAQDRSKWKSTVEQAKTHVGVVVLSVNVCVCVYIYTYIHTYTHTSIYIYIYIYMYIYTHTHTYTHTHIWLSVCNMVIAGDKVTRAACIIIIICFAIGAYY